MESIDEHIAVILPQPANQTYKELVKDNLPDQSTDTAQIPSEAPGTLSAAELAGLGEPDGMLSADELVDLSNGFGNAPPVGETFTMAALDITPQQQPAAPSDDPKLGGLTKG